jgi:hypothetical protein
LYERDYIIRYFPFLCRLEIAQFMDAQRSWAKGQGPGQGAAHAGDSEEEDCEEAEEATAEAGGTTAEPARRPRRRRRRPKPAAALSIADSFGRLTVSAAGAAGRAALTSLPPSLHAAWAQRAPEFGDSLRPFSRVAKVLSKPRPRAAHAARANAAGVEAALKRLGMRPAIQVRLATLYSFVASCVVLHMMLFVHKQHLFVHTQQSALALMAASSFAHWADVHHCHGTKYYRRTGPMWRGAHSARGGSNNVLFVWRAEKP